MSLDTFFQGLSILLSLGSLGVAFYSIHESKKANDYSSTANRIAEKANELARKANKIAHESQNIEAFASVSNFRVKLETIQFSNDTRLYMSAEEAVQNGALSCKFSVENIADNDAYSVRMGSIDEDSKDIPSKERVTLLCSTRGYVSALNELTYHVDYDNYSMNPKSGNVQKDGYKFRTYLYWKNGRYIYSCYVIFECLVKNIGSRESPQWDISPFSDKECDVKGYQRVDYLDKE